jgi:molybdopterin-containing oxidoreductase family membrane subunit
MWLERFVIVVISLHRDFLPSSWGMYWPTIWDIMLFAGTIGFFTFMMFLFIRYVPMIAVFEMRHLLHELKDQGNGHTNGHLGIDEPEADSEPLTAHHSPLTDPEGTR